MRPHHADFTRPRRLASARSLARLAALGALPAFSASCATAPEPPYPPAAAVVTVQPRASEPVPPVRDDGRLPETVTPTRVGLALAVDPGRERFSGSERILVKVPRPTSHVVLHAHDLHIQQASVVVKGERFGAITKMRLAHGGFEPEEMVVSFDPPIPAGDAELDFIWDAPYSKNLMGLSREEDGGRWYAFSDCEPTHARNMFPSFDEPSYKVPYDVSVTVPKGMRAFANAAETGHTDSADATTYSFAPTPPLPTYLVAIAAGDLDVKEGAANGVPLRVLATKGKAELGGLSLKEGAGLVKALGDYFGIAYPYPKLDLVAVPDFAPGAMENPGLITFREVLLLVDPTRGAASVRKRQELVIAHELAHQWFGDLVTLAWWNDTWLNEGFASWAQTKAIERYRPESRAVLDRVPATDAVMNDDALGSARAVRQPVTTVAQAMEAFDHITYDKGAAILGMIESWVGEDTFQHAVHDYLSAHAWGNATAADLFAALGKGSGKPVGAVATSFVDRPGVPEVDVAIECGATRGAGDAGNAAKAGGTGKGWSVSVTESTWKVLGSEAAASAASWRLPVCIRVAGQKDVSCVELTPEAPSKSATGNGACPAYVEPNVGMKGYYRASLGEKETRALARAAASLDTAARVGVIGNTWASVRSGKLAPAVLFEVLALFDKDEDHLVVEQVVTVLRAMNDALVDEESRPAFRAYVRARLAGHAHVLGWSGGEAPKSVGPDPDDASLARRAVLPALGELGGDEATLAQAETYARAWLADPASVDPSIAQIAVELSSHRAKGDRLDALAGVDAHATTPEIHVLAQRASAQFDDPAVQQRALDRLVTDAVKKQDVIQILRPAMAYVGSRKTTAAWIESHWDALRAKLSGPLVRGAFAAAALPCTREAREHAEQFFTPRAKDVETGGRILRESLETSAMCTELHAKDAPAVNAFLKHTKLTAEPTLAKGDVAKKTAKKEIPKK